MHSSVACLCVIKPGRESMALRAIRGFCLQTYPNKVLVLAGAPDAVNALSARARKMAIATGRVSSDRIQGKSLPAGVGDVMEICRLLIRNIDTDLVCFMDDDDVSHPFRLTRQIAAMVAAPDKPVFLTGGFYHFLPVNELFVVEHEQRFLSLWSRVIPHSFVAPVAAIPATLKLTHRNIGANLGRALLDACGREGPTRICYEPWWLKVGVHDDNRQGYDYFVELVHNKDRSPGSAELYGRECYLTRLLADYAWDDGDIRVCGHDGLSFVYHPLPETTFPPLTFKNFDAVEENVP